MATPVSTVTRVEVPLLWPVHIEATAPIVESRATPVSAQTIQAPPETIQGGIDDWLRAAGWPDALLGEARAVAFCESRWHPDSVNTTGAGSYGLMQMWLGWFPWAGEDPAQWASPVVNARVALRVYEHDGDWRQWACRP